MLVSYIRVTSQINCGDVIILNQKRLSLATTAKSAIDNYFGGIECSGHQIACKKYNNTFVTVNNDFWVTRDTICQWFSSQRILLANRLTRDPEIVIHGKSCIVLYMYTTGREYHREYNRYLTKLDITSHVWASQLSDHCDVINNRYWRHQQNVNRSNEVRCRCVKIVFFIIIYGFVMSCKK